MCTGMNVACDKHRHFVSESFSAQIPCYCFIQAYLCAMIRSFRSRFQLSANSTMKHIMCLSQEVHLLPICFIYSCCVCVCACLSKSRKRTDFVLLQYCLVSTWLAHCKCSELAWTVSETNQRKEISHRATYHSYRMVSSGQNANYNKYMC